MEPKQNVTLTREGGLKCDAPECDYKDATIDPDDYAKWVNAPCPKCGANLLTQADYESAKMLEKVVDLVNAMDLSELEAIPGLNEELETTFSFNGSGNIDINIQKVSESNETES